MKGVARWLHYILVYWNTLRVWGFSRRSRFSTTRTPQSPATSGGRRFRSSSALSACMGHRFSSSRVFSALSSSKKRPCLVCEEKDKTILVMAEQIEYLRVLVGTPKFGVAAGRDARDEPRLVPSAVPPHVSEDEEDIRALLAGGHLPDDVAKEALEQIGASVTTIEFDRFNDAS